jgi:hypothetical protein
MKEYSDEELKAIEDEPLVVQKSASDDNSDTIKATSASTDEDPNAEGSSEDEAEDEDESEDDSGDATMMQMMTEMQKLLSQILTEIGNLKGKAMESSEVTQENFVELQLKTEAIANMLEYSEKKKAPAAPPVEPQVVGEVSAELIETLERIKSL